MSAASLRTVATMAIGSGIRLTVRLSCAGGGVETGPRGVRRGPGECGEAPGKVR
jgi:hypothetical protein